MRLWGSNPPEQTLLYAGTPLYPAVLVHVTGSGYVVGAMGSDNPTGGDNQQERPSSPNWLDEVPDDLGHWIAGFVDGEGSFNVPIRRERDRRLPWRVGQSFNVSQRGRRAAELLEQTFAVWDHKVPTRRRRLLRGHQTDRSARTGYAVLRTASSSRSQSHRSATVCGDPRAHPIRMAPRP